MAWILYRTDADPNPDKKGMFVAAYPDEKLAISNDIESSKADGVNPCYKIISIPGAPTADFDHLREAGLTRKRQWGFDWTSDRVRRLVNDAPDILTVTQRQWDDWHTDDTCVRISDVRPDDA